MGFNKYASGCSPLGRRWSASAARSEVLLGVRGRSRGGAMHLRSSHQLQTLVHIHPKLRVTRNQRQKIVIQHVPCTRLPIRFLPLSLQTPPAPLSLTSRKRLFSAHYRQRQSVWGLGGSSRAGLRFRLVAVMIHREKPGSISTSPEALGTASVFINSKCLKTSGSALEPLVQL